MARSASRLFGLAVLLLSMNTPGRASSLDSAGQLCAIMNATGLLKAQCQISSWASTVGLLMDLSEDQAQKTCTGVRDLAAENGLVFDIHWTITIVSPKDGKTALAVCKLERAAPSAQSFGLRPATE